MLPLRHWRPRLILLLSVRAWIAYRRDGEIYDKKVVFPHFSSPRSRMVIFCSSIEVKVSRKATQVAPHVYV